MNNIVAAHEAGHVVALAAAGIYDELDRVVLGHGNAQGQSVDGLTIRSGRSLLDLSREIGTMIAQGPRQYADYMLTHAVDTCFPHICFFAGGYAIEDCLNPQGNGKESRAAIDRQHVRMLVMPAMGLPKVDEDLFNVFWNWGVDFVKSAIESNKDIVSKLVAFLEHHGGGEINSDQINDVFLDDANRIARCADFTNNSTVRLARERYESVFREQNPWMRELRAR